MGRPRTRTRSAESGKFVDKEQASTEPATTVTETVKENPVAAKKNTKEEDFVFPDPLGNDYHPYRLKTTFQVKQLEDPIHIKGVKGEPGDYVFQASDGGVGILTEEELNKNYVPYAPSPAA
jgi:hypothetical protein